jgi:multidrug transporter EmrE-like cation transporter
LILGGVNVLFFTKALKDIKLSIGYPVFSGGCIFFMALFSYAIPTFAIQRPMGLNLSHISF